MQKAFLREQDDKHLLANGIWQALHIFGKW